MFVVPYEDARNVLLLLLTGTSKQTPLDCSFHRRSPLVHKAVSGAIAGRAERSGRKLGRTANQLRFDKAHGNWRTARWGGPGRVRDAVYLQVRNFRIVHVKEDVGLGVSAIRGMGIRERGNFGTWLCVGLVVFEPELTHRLGYVWSPSVLW